MTSGKVLSSPSPGLLRQLLSCSPASTDEPTNSETEYEGDDVFSDDEEEEHSRGVAIPIRCALGSRAKAALAFSCSNWGDPTAGSGAWGRGLTRPLKRTVLQRRQARPGAALAFPRAQPVK